MEGELRTWPWRAVAAAVSEMLKACAALADVAGALAWQGDSLARQIAEVAEKATEFEALLTKLRREADAESTAE